MMTGRCRSSAIIKRVTQPRSWERVCGRNRDRDAVPFTDGVCFLGVCVFGVLVVLLHNRGEFPRVFVGGPDLAHTCM